MSGADDDRRHIFAARPPHGAEIISLSRGFLVHIYQARDALSGRQRRARLDGSRFNGASLISRMQWASDYWLLIATLSKRRNSTIITLI